MDSFSIRNFGCRVNQAEAFAWACEFQKRGLRHEERVGRGGLVIVNTCTLTGRADRDARKFVRKVLRENPSAKVVVTGCLAERDPKEFESLTGVWRVVPNRDKDGLVERLVPALGSVAETNESRGIRTVRARAFVKVQDGCDMSCAFCVIPSVRGRSTSVPASAILSRIGEMSGFGFREVVLTGIHLSSYGHDLRPRSSLADLIGAIEDLEADLRIRLSSLDPRLLTESLIERLARSPKICQHFHLSLQHGSDDVLRAMGRTSTAARYRELLEQLSLAAPNASLGADIIVGFPGETADDFRATEDFLSASPLAYIHVFSYSPRPGTAAFSRPAVDEGTKRARAICLRELSKKKNLEFRKRFADLILDGVVIRAAADRTEVLTSNDIAVRAPSNGVRKGDEVGVRITAVHQGGTLGIIIPPSPPLKKGGNPLSPLAFPPCPPLEKGGNLKTRSEGSHPA